MPHIHELYDFVIVAYIVHDNKVLLVNHPRYSLWLAPGGHIELDEDPEQALYREIVEETGLEVEILQKKPPGTFPGMKFIPAPTYIDVHEANLPHKHIGLVYFAKALTNKSVKSDEHTDMRWFTEDELSKSEYGIRPSIQMCCREALKLATDVQE